MTILLPMVTMPFAQPVVKVRGVLFLNGHRETSQRYVILVRIVTDRFNVE